MPAIQLHSLALAAAAQDTPAVPVDETIEEWVMSSTTDIAFLLKGALMGIFAGLLLASLTCCWLPCLHFLYSNPGEHLHDLQISSYRLRFYSDGGVREGIMRRVRVFFMGRDRPAAAPDVEGADANGTGGDGVRDQQGPARGRRQQGVHMQPAVRPSASDRQGYNPYDVSHHPYIRDEEDEVVRDWIPRVYLPSQRPLYIPSA